MLSVSHVIGTIPGRKKNEFQKKMLLRNGGWFESPREKWKSPLLLGWVDGVMVLSPVVTRYC